jgi:hypothetical protein
MSELYLVRMLSVKRFHLTDKEKNSTGLVVFNTNIPMPPHPKDKYNPTREEGSINAQAETRSVLQRLINLLAPYQPTRIMEAERGEILEVLAKPYGMGEVVGAQMLPWDLIARPDPESTAENPPYLVTVQPGMLSGFLAVNWDDEFTCNATGLYYAKAVVTTDGSAITQVEIEIDTNAPVQQSPELWTVPATVDYLFGMFTEGTIYRTIGPSHIEISPKVWITTEKAALPAPGELPYDYYYVLG